MIVRENRSNQEWTTQRQHRVQDTERRQHRVQDTERRQTNHTHNTEH